jgi:Protein of unknown function (DUF3040)
MSLPACQQRTLDRIEGALQASEPRLASMYAMFAKLSDGEPVGAEPLAEGGRRRRMTPGGVVSAVVLIPMMFALIVTGVLLGGRAHSAGRCAAGHLTGSDLLHLSLPSCGTQQRTASAAGPTSCPGSTKQIGAVTAHFAIWARDAQAEWPAGQPAAAAANPAGLC